MTILAWFFVAMTPFVLAALFVLALCEAAKLGDEKTEIARRECERRTR